MGSQATMQNTKYLDDADDAGSRYVTDAEIEAYDTKENSGESQPVLYIHAIVDWLAVIS